MKSRTLPLNDISIKKVVQQIQHGSFTATHQPEKDIESSMKPNFDFFINSCHYSTYEMGIFGKLADNGLLGCSGVVGADA